MARLEPVFDAHGFIQDGRLNVLLRNYLGYFDNGSTERRAWVQGMRLYYESGYVRGPVDFGIDLAPFVGLKLNGGKGAKNMVHVGSDPSAPNENAWNYLGEYVLKANVLDLHMRYGLQTISNPFLKPYDNRALPPTFKGLALSRLLGRSISLKGGRFHAVNARGADRLQRLATSYTAVPVERLTYAGAEWERADGTRVMAYAGEARDLWRQYYVSLPVGAGGAGTVQWVGKLDGYLTRGTRRQRQGSVDNAVWSASMTVRGASSSLVVAFQKNASDTYFDFLQETSGIYLANAMGNDFNAPREKSVQLRYRFGASGPGAPSFGLMMWAISGWGADGAAGANAYGPEGGVADNPYRKNGAPIGGTHQEYGFNPSFTFQSGALKGARVFMVVTIHNVSARYPGKSFRDWRIMADVPLQIF